MSHGNTVTDCNRGKYHRRPSGHGHSQLYSFHDLIQIHMARHNLIIGAYDANHGLFHLFFRHSKGIEQGAVRRLLHTCLYCITSHMSDLLLWGNPGLFMYSVLSARTDAFCDPVAHLRSSDPDTAFGHNISRPVSVF